MERDPLNFFQPFERLPPNHENQLTRALLVVLRLSAVAHARWLSRLKVARGLHKSVTSFRTQRRAVRQQQDPEERVPVISVFLAPKAPLGEDAVVRESQRDQVLDAIIEYGGELVVVIENKVADASGEQALNLNIEGAGVQIAEGDQVRLVLWPDLLADLAALVERGRVSGAEAALLTDFLQYAEDHFPRLGPYHTLGLARGNDFRITRRLRAVLSEAGDNEAWIDRGGRPSLELPELFGVAALAYLHHDTRDGDDHVELSVYPADTLAQARAFYANAARVARVRDLVQEHGWSLAPNFHFGHFQAGYAWCRGDIDTARYLELWAQEIGDARELRRAAWPAYWEWLLREGIAAPVDRSEFDRHFTNTDRQKAAPRPGLSLARRWPMDEAERLDAVGSFAGEVRKALETAIASLDS